MRNGDRFIWLGGEIVPVDEAKINVLSPTSQFGANVFEGIRGYYNEKESQLYLFRLQEHHKRLKNSIKMFKMESRYTEDDFINSVMTVIKKNNYKENIAIRQTVFIDGDGTWSARGPINMFVAPIPKITTLDKDDNCIKCCISSFERISDKNMSPHIKMGANYINSRFAQMEALENGYNSAILMNSFGKISEGPGSCFMMVRDNMLITPPISASVLESITRDTLITLAKEEGIEVCVRDIDRTELYICDEAFLCGSAVEITPINSVDGYVVGDKKKGMITKLLSMKYLNAITGNDKKHTDWLTAVYDRR